MWRAAPLRLRARRWRPPGVGALPTGVPALDAALGGGWPRGALIEITGPPSSGKSALGAAALEGAWAQGGLGALLSLDGPASALRLTPGAAALGLSPPQGAALASLRWLLERAPLSCLVVDTTLALQSEAGPLRFRLLQGLAAQAERRQIALLFLSPAPAPGPRHHRWRPSPQGGELAPLCAARLFLGAPSLRGTPAWLTHRERGALQRLTLPRGAAHSPSAS